jgi:hypothetical protein
MTKMRLKIVLSIFLVGVLVLITTGCKKITGGGWFINDGWEGMDNSIIFGFTAQPTGEPISHNNPFYPPDIELQTAKGKFQLIDRNAKTRIHGTFIGTYIDEDDIQSTFWGLCSINGEDGHLLEARFTDNGEPGVLAGDRIEVWIDSPVGIAFPPNYMGTLKGGNIQIHDDEE